jgi:Trypsin-co-occurring domain 1
VDSSASPEEDVSAFDKVLPFKSVVDSVGAVSEAMTDALRQASPKEAEVTFGLNVSVESGQLTTLIVKGGGTATFSIRLLWAASEAQPEGA